MRRILILGEHVSPQFLVLAHEFEDCVTVTIFFILDFDILDLFGLAARLLGILIRCSNTAVHQCRQF